METTNSPSRVALIIPVHKGGDKFQMCLESIAGLDPPPDEIIVVVDGDSTGAQRQAEQFGVSLFTFPTRRGPARARNLGAEKSSSGILFFVDSDVTLPVGVIERVKRTFEGDPGMAAVFGSYDDAPFEKNFLSQYKNLFHHYVHQNSREDASSFWGACGAVKREIFIELGGFEEGYRGPMIEDVELGFRMKQAGYRILLDKGLRVKHLKRWGVGSLLRADFFYRALPWTHLILRTGFLANDLNLRTADRVSTISVYVLLLSLAGSLYDKGFLIVSLITGLTLTVINRRLYLFFLRKRGLAFLFMSIPWHWFYFFYSGFAFLVGLLRYNFNRLFKNGV